MVRWNVRPLMEKRGIENGSQLAAQVPGLNAPAAYRMAAGAEIERLDVSQLEAVAAFFGVSLWQCLEHVPDKGKKR